VKKHHLTPANEWPNHRPAPPWGSGEIAMTAEDRARVDAVIAALEEPSEDAMQSVSSLGYAVDSPKSAGSIALLSPGCSMKGRGRGHG
jgi:hypothetical protein